MYGIEAARVGRKCSFVIRECEEWRCALLAVEEQHGYDLPATETDPHDERQEKEGRAPA